MMPHTLTIDVQQSHVELVWRLDPRYGMTPFHPALLDRFGKSTVVTVDAEHVHIEQPDGQKATYDLTPEAHDYLTTFQEAVLDGTDAHIPKAFAPVAFTLEIHQDNPTIDPQWEQHPTKGSYYKLIRPSGGGWAVIRVDTTRIRTFPETQGRAAAEYRDRLNDRAHEYDLNHRDL